MRAFSVVIVVLGVSVSGGLGVAQSEAPPAQERLESYNKHHDTRFGHDHFYPDRGAIVKAAPKGAAVVNYAGLAFRFYDGVWYEPRGPAFMVVAPPVGLLVPSLPSFATLLARNGQTLVYCNDVYYRPRPDVNGYEVVNDPTEPAFQVAADSASGGEPTGIVESAAAISSAPMPASVQPVPPEPASPPGIDPVQPPAPPATGAQNFAVPPPVAVTATPLPDTAPVRPAATSSLAGAGASASNAVAAGSGPVATGASSVPSKGIKVALVAKNAQDSDQQARDRYECYRFAVAQSGFDPMHASGPNSDYDRAQAACFEGRGYALR